MNVSEEQRSILNEWAAGFAAVGDELIAEICVNAPYYVGAHTRAEAAQRIELLSEKFGDSPDDVRAALGWVSTIAQTVGATSVDDDVRALMEVLDEIEPKDLLESRVKAVANATASFQSRIAEEARVRVATSGLLPFFDSFQATVELRAIAGSNRSGGAPLALLRDEEIALVPIASIRIALDSGHPASFVFQAGLHELVALQSAVSNLVKALEVLSTRVTGESHGSAE